MKKQRSYALICLTSLLLFFQPPILFISDLLVSIQLEEIIDHSDIENQENTNRTTNPLEEEVLHPSLSIEDCIEIPVPLELENGQYSFKMKTSSKENTTPPPKNA